MKNEQETWRDVWDETCAAMANLEQCIDTALEVERAVLKEQRARICSVGVAKALALMTECVRQVRTPMRGTDFQLTSAVICSRLKT